MIKAIIFDWGGVLIEPNEKQHAAYLAKALKVSQEKFIRELNKVEDAFMKGDITEREVWRKICSKLDVPRPKVTSLWTKAMIPYYKESKEVLTLISSLRKAGYKVAILSNTEKPIVRHFYRYQRYFDEEIFSCYEGIIKPQKSIFLVAMRKLGVNPSGAVYIDDKKAYALAAGKAGLKAIWFTSPKKLRKSLQSYGVNLRGLREKT